MPGSLKTLYAIGGTLLAMPLGAIFADVSSMEYNRHANSIDITPAAQAYLYSALEGAPEKDVASVGVRFSDGEDTAIGRYKFTPENKLTSSDIVGSPMKTVTEPGTLRLVHEKACELAGRPLADKPFYVAARLHPSLDERRDFYKAHCVGVNFDKSYG